MKGLSNRFLAPGTERIGRKAYVFLSCLLGGGGEGGEKRGRNCPKERRTVKGIYKSTGLLMTVERKKKKKMGSSKDLILRCEKGEERENGWKGKEKPEYSCTCL